MKTEQEIRDELARCERMYSLYTKSHVSHMDTIKAAVLRYSDQIAMLHWVLGKSL